MGLELQKHTLSCFFMRIVEKYSENSAVAFVGEEPITYQELGYRVLALRDFLKERGVRKGDKVILLGENSINWVVAYFGITTIGAVVVPVLSEFPEADINHIVLHSGAVAAFVDKKIFTNLDLKSLEEIQEVFSLDEFKALKKHVPRKDTFWNKLQAIPGKIEKALKGSKKGLLEQARDEVDEDDLAEILYTSGTTGRSKGVMLTHRNITTNAITGPDVIGGVDETAVVLNLLPLAHAYGSTTTMLGAFSRGAVLYLLKKKPSPKILMQAVATVRPTLIAGVPLVFEKIYHKKVLPEIKKRRILRLVASFGAGRRFLYRKVGEKLKESFGGRLYSFMIGGASLNREVEIFLREGNVPFSVGYGLSECSPLVAGAYYRDCRLGSVGRAIPGVEIRIAKEDPADEVGEIQVRGPNVMKGYYKNPEDTKQVFTRDGWLRTGDLGYLDDEGFLFIKGRSKNVYVGPSGENIYPENIEDKLRECEYVEEALVYVDEGKIVARVYLDYEYIQGQLNAPQHVIQSREIDRILEKIRQETNQKLPKFSQIQKVIEQTEPFVKTPTNKIKRPLYVPNYGKRSAVK